MTNDNEITKMPEQESRDEKFHMTKIEKIAVAGGAILIIAIFAVISLTKWSLVDYPFFGGLFNQTFLGVQLYIFLGIFAALLYVASYIWWVKLKWNMMSPFQGLWYAQNAQTDVVFRTDLQLNFKLQSEAGAKLVFPKERYNAIAVENTLVNKIRMWLMPVDQSVHVAKYLQGSWDSKPMTNIGSVPASILLDANGWTKDVSPERLAIAEVCDKHNDLNGSDQIHSLSKAWDYMDKGKIPTPSNVELYVKIPWSRLDNAYPAVDYGASSGGFVRQLAELIAAGLFKPTFSLTTAGIIVFITCLGISCMMFITKVMTHVPGK